MNGGTFTVTFATPVERFVREAVSLRVTDLSGNLGIMRNHADFVTVLAPSLGIYRTARDEEVFLAINGGVLTVAGGKVTVLSREIVESRRAESLTWIAALRAMKGDKTEAEFRETLAGVIRTFWKMNIEAEKADRAE